MGQISKSTIPAIFLAWADHMQFPMPAKLVDGVKALGHQIADWKTAYYAQKKIADDAVAEHLEEQRKHVASIREHASIVAKMREEQETLTQKCVAKVDELETKNAELSARIADLESAETHEPEKPLGGRERDSMLKLIIGMAIKGYVYDPKAGRSGTVREIADDLRRAGLALDVDTIRKYLSEAKELLPGPETEQKA
jgi:hypothetical protein